MEHPIFSAPDWLWDKAKFFGRIFYNVKSSVTSTKWSNWQSIILILFGKIKVDKIKRQNQAVRSSGLEKPSEAEVIRLLYIF